MNNRKSIYEQIEEQEAKLKALKKRKREELEKSIANYFRFLLNREIFPTFVKKIEEDKEFLENLKKYILKELKIDIKEITKKENNKEIEEVDNDE